MTDLDQQRFTRDGKDGSEVAKVTGRGKLILGSILFFGLTLGIFTYQFSVIPAGHGGPSWSELRWGYMVLILLVLPVEPLAAGLRIWLVSRVLHPGLNLGTCIKTDFANIAISMLTPSQTGGGAAQVYMLNRKGVPAGTALTICLLSFVGTMVALLCLGLYSLAVSGMASTAPFFAAAAWTLTSISLLIVLTLISPGLFRWMFATASRVSSRMRGSHRILQLLWSPGTHKRAAQDRMGAWTTKFMEMIFGYRRDVVSFVRAGKGTFVAVCILSFVFLLSRSLLAYLCVRFLAVDASTLRNIIEAQLSVIFVIFFAPTPGGAGLAEVASSAMVTGILPMAFIPYYHLLWRFSTLYLSAIVGICCLLRTILQDTQNLVRHRRETGWPLPGDRRDRATTTSIKDSLCGTIDDRRKVL